MLTVRNFGILGAHSAGDDEVYDAADLLLYTHGGTRVIGFRTEGFFAEHDPFDPSFAGVQDWGGYTPLAISLNRRSVEFWDFSNVLWIGPEPHPCLFWSNADGIARRGLQLLFAPFGSGAILEGPSGRGLPTPQDLGIDVPDHLERVEPAQLTAVRHVSR